jgi:hypothetical protein
MENAYACEDSVVKCASDKKSNFECLLEEIKINTNRLKKSINDLNDCFKIVLRNKQLQVTNNKDCVTQKMDNAEMSSIEVFLSGQLGEINYLINTVNDYKSRCCL